MHILDYIIDFISFINPWGWGKLTTIELLENDIQELLKDKNKLKESLFKIKDSKKKMDLQYQKILVEKEDEIRGLKLLMINQEEALNLWLKNSQTQYKLIEETKNQLFELLEWKRKASLALNTYEMKNRILLKNNKDLIEELKKYKKD